MLVRNDEDLKNLCALLHSVAKVTIRCIEDTGLVLFEISENDAKNPLCDYQESIYRELSSRDIKEKPQTFSSQYLENFLVLHAELEDKRVRYIILGPSIAHLPGDSLDLIIDIELSSRDRAALNRYYRQLPVINYHDLIKLGILVYFLLNRKVIDFDSINTVGNALQNFHWKVENEYNIQYRDVRYLHRSSFFERHFYELIKNGESEKLKELLSVHSLDGEFIVLAKSDPLRSWKNLVICFITISSRAAMEGGLATETTYAISEVYIQELEELATIAEVEDHANKVFIDLARRVKEIKRYHYSKLVSSCLNFISDNLDQTISLSRIAEELKINGSYLSHTFKREVGISLTEYIMQEKIREAKRMLLFTQFSLLDISTALGFYDQSHFAKAFKKSTGFPPKQFRDNHSSSTLWY